MFNRVKNFCQEAYQELKRVNWPTREEAIRYTIFVVCVSLALSLFLGLLDFIFIKALEKIISFKQF